jgi:hypothetical protein
LSLNTFGSGLLSGTLVSSDLKGSPGINKGSVTSCPPFSAKKKQSFNKNFGSRAYSRVLIIFIGGPLKKYNENYVFIEENMKYFYPLKRVMGIKLQQKNQAFL